MRIMFKLTKRLLEKVHARLEQSHPFAFERVGFLLCRSGRLDDGGVVILADYLDDPGVGAMMGPNAIRKALQTSYNRQASMFHVHMHLHRGRPHFSGIDETESAKFVPDFWNVQPYLPHGAIVLSEDSACGKSWIPGLQAPVEISQFSVVGIPMRGI